MARSKKAMANEVKKQMIALGTYKPEYDKMIQIFSGMLFQYQEFEKQFEESGYQITEEYTNKAGATNQRKVPLLTALESLRKDIASFSDKLCLNPKALGNVAAPKKKTSKLTAALSEYRK